MGHELSPLLDDQGCAARSRRSVDDANCLASFSSTRSLLQLRSIAPRPAMWAATPAVRISTDAFVPVDCYVFKLTVSEKAAQCGYVSVPLRHADKDSPRIKLAVTVLPEGADRVAANLANSYRVTFASGTHGQAFVVPCANAIVTSFLDTPAEARPMTRAPRKRRQYSGPPTSC